MNNPIVYVFLGYVIGVVLGLLGGLDAMVRVGRAGAKVTTRSQALRWLLGVPEETE